MHSTAPSRYAGDFVAWNGGAVFVGEGGGPVSPHAHYAIQCVVGLPDGLKVQFGRRGSWQGVAGALMPSRATHAIDVTHCRWSAVMFIEPDTRFGRAIAARLRQAPEVLDAEAVAGTAACLERAWRTESHEDAVRRACLQWLQALAGVDVPPAPDARVLAAIERIAKSGEEMPTLEALAAGAYLSPSRFRHLFVESTGMPLRTYLLWRRLLRAWDRLVQGDTIAQAAHAAGFADAAHLTRTCRVMFGLAPSAMAMAGPISLKRRHAPH